MKKIKPEFIGERITALRRKKGVSECRMSYELGHSRSYINNIAKNKCMPKMKEFLSICDYFDMTPAEFFQPEQGEEENEST